MDKSSTTIEMEREACARTEAYSRSLLSVVDGGPTVLTRLYEALEKMCILDGNGKLNPKEWDASRYTKEGVLSTYEMSTGRLCNVALHYPEELTDTVANVIEELIHVLALQRLKMTELLRTLAETEEDEEMQQLVTSDRESEVLGRLYQVIQSIDAGIDTSKPLPEDRNSAAAEILYKIRTKDVVAEEVRNLQEQIEAALKRVKNSVRQAQSWEYGALYKDTIAQASEVLHKLLCLAAYKRVQLYDLFNRLDDKERCHSSRFKREMQWLGKPDQ